MWTNANVMADLADIVVGLLQKSSVMAALYFLCMVLLLAAGGENTELSMPTAAKKTCQ